jgi:Protein of unknown function (DUF3187)
MEGSHMRLRTVLFFAPVVIAMLATFSRADQGPLPVVNRFPLHLLFLTPRPVSPEIPEVKQIAAALGVEYSSIFFDHHNQRWDVLMDMEMMTLDLSVEYGLAPRLAIRLDAPVVMMNDGFLDGFLANYHDMLGVPNYGREKRPANTFAYQVSKDGDLWLDGRSGNLMVADATFSLEVELHRPSSKRGLADTLIASMKLPVGDSEKGLGSGAWDYAVYWSVAWYAERWSLYVMPGLAWIGDPDTLGADITARNSASLFVGTAYHYSPKWHWLAQINGYTSPIESTGLSDLDNGSLELDLGFQYRIRDPWTMVFGFGEDLTRAAPDFTVHLGLMWRYGR